MIKLLFTVILMISSKSLAARVDSSCTPVDMRNRFAPVRNEGPYGSWCYAFATADLVGEAEGISPRTPLSAFDVAATFLSANRAHYTSAAKAVRGTAEVVGADAEVATLDSFRGLRPENRTGGYTDLAATLYLQQNQACPESKVPSETHPDPFGDLTLSQIAHIALSPQADPRSYIERQMNRLSDEAPVSCPNALSLANPQLVKGINDFAAFQLKVSVNKECKGSPPFRKPAVVRSEFDVVVKGVERPLEPQIDQLLSRGRPVDISYDLCHLLPKGSHLGCAHESIVAGRRRNPSNGTCEYLVRDSHGPHCKTYQGMPHVECDEKNPGYFWVDKEALKPALGGITWIETDLRNVPRSE